MQAISDNVQSVQIPSVRISSFSQRKTKSWETGHTSKKSEYIPRPDKRSANTLKPVLAIGRQKLHNDSFVTILLFIGEQLTTYR